MTEQSHYYNSCNAIGDGLREASNGFNSTSESGNNGNNDMTIQPPSMDTIDSSSVLCYSSPYEITKLANNKSATLALGSYISSNHHHHLKNHHRIHSSINASYSEANKLVNSNGDIVNHSSNDLTNHHHLSPIKGKSLTHCCNNSETMYATVKRTPRAPRSNSNGDANGDTCHVYQYPLPLSTLLHANYHSFSNGNGNSIAGSESCCGDTQSCNSFASTTNGIIDAPTTEVFFPNEDNDKELTTSTFKINA